MSAKKHWGAEEREKVIRAFHQVYPEWEISSNQKRCPECARQHPHRQIGLNFCKYHHFASERWLGRMAILIAFRDPQFKDKLKSEGLWLREEAE